MSKKLIQLSALFFFAGVITAVVFILNNQKLHAEEIIVYKSETCGCCNKWVDHLREHGFKVITHNREDMSSVKQSHGVDFKLRSCHTAVVNDYVVEGHVPADDIKRLLEERPKITGLAAPGMPAGSPGMEGRYKDPYDVLAFTKGGGSTVYARH